MGLLVQELKKLCELRMEVETGYMEKSPHEKEQKKLLKKEKKLKKIAVEWAEAKKLCRLNDEDVRMARELGMSPRDAIKNRPNRSEQWKEPVKDWIHDLYEKRFGGRSGSN